MLWPYGNVKRIIYSLLKVMRTNYNFNSADSIESIIDSIGDTLAAYAPAGTTVKKVAAERGMSCKGMIIVTRAAKSGESLSEAPAVVKYAFYANPVCPNRIGSVAIYAADTTPILAEIRRSGTLFGFRVLRATLERGRRPFIDVTVVS